MDLSKSTMILESYSDPKFEARYEELERDLSVFMVQAKQDATEIQLVTVKQLWIRLINPIKFMIQPALDFNYSLHQPYSNVAVAQGLRSQAFDEISELEKEKNEKERIILPLENELKSLKQKCKKGISTTLRIVIPAVFGICEGVLVANMLLANSMSIIVVFFLSLLTALIAAFGLHFGANFICKAKTVQIKRIRYIIVLTSAFIVSLCLGMWRAQGNADASNINSQIELHQPISGTSNSIWPFVIISFASFVVALAFEIKYWLSDEEKKQLKQYEEKQAELRKEEYALQALKNKIRAIKANSDFDSGSIMHKQEYACSNEPRLVSLGRQIVSQYERIYVDNRKDKQCPAFFGEPVNFEFKFYFNHLFNSLNGKQ